MLAILCEWDDGEYFSAVNLLIGGGWHDFGVVTIRHGVRFSSYWLRELSLGDDVL